MINKRPGLFTAILIILIGLSLVNYSGTEQGKHDTRFDLADHLQSTH